MFVLPGRDTLMLATSGSAALPLSSFASATFFYVVRKVDPCMVDYEIVSSKVPV